MGTGYLTDYFKLISMVGTLHHLISMKVVALDAKYIDNYLYNAKFLFLKQFSSIF